MFSLLNQDLNIQILGIGFDIIGAFYLSRAFIFKKPADIKSETYGSANQNFLINYGMSGNLFFSFYTQGIEARMGFIILSIGFILQAIGLIWSFLILPIYVILLITILALIICELVRSRLTRFERVKTIHDRNEREHDKRLKR